MGRANEFNGVAQSENTAAIAGKIAEMAGNIFAMEAMTFLTSSLLDRKAGDLRIETAMCKMWSTETTWQIADDAMQVRGGRGYETAAIVGRSRRTTNSSGKISCAIAGSTRFSKARAKSCVCSSRARRLIRI